jgi:thymidylate synthase (FAD)
MIPLYYAPGVERIVKQSPTNKQGSGNALALDVGEHMSALEAAATMKAWDTYREMLAAGVAREQARRVLPASTMTGLVWQCDAHNLLHFLGLRLAPDAQLEIRRLAAQMAVEVARRFPWTWAAWLELAAPASIREMAAAQAETATE